MICNRYPDSWTEEAIGSVAEINPESLSSGTDPGHQFRYIDISSVNVGEIDWDSVTTHTLESAPSRAKRIVRPYDVLLSTVRPTLQSHTFADWPEQEGYVCSTGFAVIRTGDNLEANFLRHLVFSRLVTTQLHRLETGSNYPAVPQDDVGRVRIPLPPLPEQDRIAEILDGADEAIRQSERVIAKLREMKKGLLHDLLTCGLDAEGELRDPEEHQEAFKDSPLGRIPREWKVTDLDTLGTWRGGSTPSKSEPANWNEGTVLWLSPKDLKNSRLSSSQDKITEYALSNSGLTVFDPGDVIVVFRSGILRHSFPVAVTDMPFTVNQDLKVLIPDPSVDRAFAFWLLKGMGPRILNKAVKAGTTVESIDPFAFYHLPVALPSLKEQRRISSILSAEDAHVQVEKATLNKLRQVKRGLMDDLLTGRVRV